jgi:hypothetical protein
MMGKYTNSKERDKCFKNEIKVIGLTKSDFQNKNYARRNESINCIV